MTGKNICGSCDQNYAATLDNSFYYLILAIVELSNQHVSISKKCFSGNIVLGKG